MRIAKPSWRASPAAGSHFSGRFGMVRPAGRASRRPALSTLKTSCRPRLIHVRSTPESDRLLRCREMTLWAISDILHRRKIGEIREKLGVVLVSFGQQSSAAREERQIQKRRMRFILHDHH
jgi:hypothetical protein